MALKKLTEGQAKFFVFEEVLLLVLGVVQLYILLGMDMFTAGLTFFVNPAPPVQNVLWFVGTMVIFVTAYFFIASRDRNVIKIHNNFSKVILGSSKKKILGLDKQVAALLAFEFVFAMVIALSIYLYLDPERNLVPWPFNFISFFILLAIGVHIFSRTRVFRDETYDSGFLVQKIRPAERLFPTRRMTSALTGITRVASKKRYTKLKHVQKHGSKPKARVSSKRKASKKSKK